MGTSFDSGSDRFVPCRCYHPVTFLLRFSVLLLNFRLGLHHMEYVSVPTACEADRLGGAKGLQQLAHVADECICWVCARILVRSDATDVGGHHWTSMTNRTTNAAEAFHSTLFKFVSFHSSSWNLDNMQRFQARCNQEGFADKLLPLVA